MKQDARKLDHATLEQLRIRAVKQVQSGVSPEEVTRVLGLSRITGPMMKWIYDTIVQKNPLQFRFEFALWTREIIREVIHRKYKLRLGLSSVSRLLKQLGLSCQRPLFKAWQQNEQQVQNWLKKVFPKIKKRAKAEKADVYFADEAGLNSKGRFSVHGRRRNGYSRYFHRIHEAASTGLTSKNLPHRRRAPHP